VSRLVLLATSPRVAAGLLSAEAWSTLRAGPVFASDDAGPTAVALVAAGIPVEAIRNAGDLAATARLLVDAADRAGVATWLLAGNGEPDLVAALSRLGCRAGDSAGGLLEGPAGKPELEVLDGSWDLPGARLIDVVATMDRLRSPGGCPWDAEQDHRSLAPYLLEEAYEAFQAVEDDDLLALRAELGDVLLQVVFHARLAQENDKGHRWDVDDVATGLIEKLERRHPHVFGDVTVSGADQVNANWNAIKAAERGGRPPLADVPLSAPALTLAATLQRKSAATTHEPLRSAGLASDPSDALDAFERAPSAVTAGQLLWVLVSRFRELGIDAEAALRATARDFRDGHIEGHRRTGDG
jgi:XTP/dITP diphosphohydrolase